MIEAFVSLFLTLALFLFSTFGYAESALLKNTASNQDYPASGEQIIKREMQQLLTLKRSFYTNTDNSVTIVVTFAGDCTIGYDEAFSYEYSFPYVLERQNNNYGYFFEKVNPLFNNDDLTVVNLETTLTNATRKADKKFRFKGNPEYVNILKEGNIEIVNISNNHIHDYLEQGFMDTIRTLEDAGIYYSGEGYIATYEAKGIKIASLGYGGWSTAIKEALANDIRKVKEFADIVIVSFHWGQERINYPNSTQIQLGRFAVDSGADVVIGHHPHVIQGVEKYKDKYILYSLGNFSFGGNKNPSDKDCILFQNIFEFKKNKLTKNNGIIIPCQISSTKSINDYQPIILEDQEKERVLNRIYGYSSRLEYGIKEE